MCNPGISGPIPTLFPQPPAKGRRRRGRAGRRTRALAPGHLHQRGGDTTAPPPVTFLTPNGALGHGDIFITPTGDTSTYANGPEILSPTGQVVWFHTIPAGETAADFRTQTYDGQPVLTWWQGTGLGGLSSGTDYIYNDHYQQIATVNAGQRTVGRWPRVPHHSVEHRADPLLHHCHRRPHFHRRSCRPDGHQRRGARDRHQDRQSALPVEQRGPRSLQSE